LATEKDKDGKKIERELILDIIFKKWWSDALMHPQEYGITKVCVVERATAGEINAVTQLLEKVFYSTYYSERAILLVSHALTIQVRKEGAGRQSACR
jgi:hypothetical protein